MSSRSRRDRRRHFRPEKSHPGLTELRHRGGEWPHRELFTLPRHNVEALQPGQRLVDPEFDLDPEMLLEPGFDRGFELAHRRRARPGAQEIIRQKRLLALLVLR